MRKENQKLKKKEEEEKKLQYSSLGEYSNNWCFGVFFCCMNILHIKQKKEY